MYKRIQEEIAQRVALEKSMGKEPDLEEICKSFSSDLSARFPNGRWVTMNGSKVFINNGKAIFGAPEIIKLVNEEGENTSKNNITVKNKLFSAQELKPMNLSKEEKQAFAEACNELKEYGISGDLINFYDRGAVGVSDDLKSALNKATLTFILEHAKENGLDQMNFEEVEELIYSKLRTNSFDIKRILKALAINTKKISVVDTLDLGYINIK